MERHPTEIKLRKKSRILDIVFDDGRRFAMSLEYLRVFSPSAEVRGHGPGQMVLVVDKEDVNLSRIEPVGSYAVRLVFDDGHDSGIYSWDVLYDLGDNQHANWGEYLSRLREQGYRHSQHGEDQQQHDD